MGNSKQRVTDSADIETTTVSKKCLRDGKMDSVDEYDVAREPTSRIEPAFDSILWIFYNPQCGCSVRLRREPVGQIAFRYNFSTKLVFASEQAGVACFGEAAAMQEDSGVLPRCSHQPT